MPEREKGFLGEFLFGVGACFWVITALMCFFVTLYILWDTFGWWTIIIGVFLAPLTYLASFFIVWFTTGVFFEPLLIPYVISFVALILVVVGLKIG